MARVHEESDDELPELSELLKSQAGKPATTATAGNTEDKTKNTCPTLTYGNTFRKEWHERQVLSTADTFQSTTYVPKIGRAESGSKEQRPLRPISSNPKSTTTLSKIEHPPFPGEKELSKSSIALAIKSTPRRTAKKTTRYVVEENYSEEDIENGIVSDDDVEESLWCESDVPSFDSEDEEANEQVPRSHSPTRRSTRGHAESKALPQDPTLAISSRRRPLPSAMRAADPVAFGTENTEFQPLQHPMLAASTSDRPSSSSSADHDAVLRYSPPRRRSPHKSTQSSAHPRTPSPSPSPSKSRLTSPSKKKRIPTPPHRLSIDAFWSQDVVNSWNDKHSPRKLLASPQKYLSLGTDPGALPQTSPKKGSPVKKDQSTTQARRSFERCKQQIAETFLKELDETITGGSIAKMAAESGGVKLVWSRKLNSTAGRANWRREGMRVQEAQGSAILYKHHASIELAEKVIDDEDRLVNVIAHEYCHLANFMISNVRDNPHGKEFKEWAKKVSTAFISRNVVVTTKHTYEIDYKYVWTCMSCGQEFKRHSKSIDPTRHSCGTCKSKLVQTKPALRQKDPSKGPSEYQLFMKENFQRIKKENESKGHGAVMEILGREYRKQKISKEAVPGVDELTRLTKTLEAIVLD